MIEKYVDLDKNLHEKLLIEFRDNENVKRKIKIKVLTME